ncbi:fatty acyl-AMP ligase [Trinickia dabaoshanensis]|uniref:Fatty acyl-AMP ligase n=1 Tax=Trinickia dabaoshanensis TaxID=564714 RepID=A0A2N7VJ79_9BURK|nr:AMP-binding protein [Trinickia dabaoshanensis]PMS17198.1 fatty acyl-AMP ligase [Trinickia dabaoshanensis]
MKDERLGSDIREARRAATAPRLLALVRSLTGEMRGDGRASPEPALDAQLERDLGFDSLARSELFIRLEAAFGVRLSVDTFARATSLRDLLDALIAQGSSPAATLPGSSPQGGEAVKIAAAQTRERSTSDGLDSPAHAQTLTEALHWHADLHPERTHVILVEPDGQTQSPLDYGALRASAMRKAGGLRALGVDPGDTVALMLPTSLEYFVTFTAILLCGAIAVPIYPPAQATQLEEHIERHAALLENAQAKVLVTFDRAETVGRLLKARVSTIRHVLTPERIEARELDTIVARHAGDIAMLQYTSGSTGAPKGVILTHGNLLANIRAMGERIDVRADDVLVSWLPLYHDMGLIGAWLAPLYFGITLVVTSPLAFLARPALWLQLVTRYRGTLTAAPNFAYARCAAHLSEAESAALDLSSLRFSFCGAEPVSAPTLRAFAERMRAARFDARALAPVYGLAENTLALTFPPASRGIVTDRILRTAFAQSGEAVRALNGDESLEIVGCGFALSNAQIRIVDENGGLQPDRRVGRIEFRGPAATQGYYRNPERTTELFDGDWLDSGDLGYLADGELYVTGRKKDLIIRGGRHFFPYELEDAVGRLSGVTPGGVAACGETDPVSGTQRLIVFVETSEAEQAARSRLIAEVNATAIRCFGAPPERIVLALPHTIPKTPSGKIRHAVLLERHAQGEKTGRALAGERQAWRQAATTLAGSIVPFARRSLGHGSTLARGLWCWAVVAALAPIVWLRIAWRADFERNWRVAAHASRIVLRAAGIRVELDPGTLPNTSVIIAANHASYVDAVILIATLPRPVHFVAKRELASRPFVGRLLRALGVRFVERTDYRTSLDDEARLVERAAADETLLFFPEGTFVRAAGLRPFRFGAFRAACVAGRSIVPVALNGARATLRDGDWFVRAGEVRVAILPAIAPAGSDFSAMALLRSQVHDVILAHCGEPEVTQSSTRY